MDIFKKRTRKPVLILRYFDDCNDLVTYINNLGIESDEIQLITQSQGGEWVLIYWF